MLLSSLSPEYCCIRDSLMTCPFFFSFFLFNLHILPFASLNLSHLIFKEKCSEIVQGVEIVSRNPLAPSIIVL